MSAVVLIRGLKSRFASQQLEENGHFAKVRFTLHVDSHFLRTLTTHCNNRGLG